MVGRHGCILDVVGKILQEVVAPNSKKDASSREETRSLQDIDGSFLLFVSIFPSWTNMQEGRLFFVLLCIFETGCKD
jgi:hypothetical protein